MARSYTNLLCHIVFSTKDRRPLISDDVAPRLHEYLGGGIRSEGGIALAINGMPDHVHILAKVRQDRAVSDVVRAIKANSSNWIHDTFPPLRTFAWQAGFGAFSVSQSQVERLTSYIRNQKIRHRKQPFTDEFVALLTAHGIDFQAKYLWV